MITAELLNSNIPALTPSHTLMQGLKWVTEYHLQHIVVVNDNNKIIGLLSEEMILNAVDLDTKAENLEWEFAPLTVPKHAHIFDIIPTLHKNQLSCIGVADENGLYLGLVTQEAIFNALANQYSMSAEGGLLLLSMKAPQYSMAEIAQIVEGNGGRVLCSYVDYKRADEEVDVLLKVNLPETDYLIATFERYEYEVKALYQNPAAGKNDKLQENYDALMNYLNI